MKQKPRAHAKQTQSSVRVSQAPGAGLPPTTNPLSMDDDLPRPDAPLLYESLAVTAKEFSANLERWAGSFAPLPPWRSQFSNPYCPSLSAPPTHPNCECVTDGGLELTSPDEIPKPCVILTDDERYGVFGRVK